MAVLTNLNGRAVGVSDDRVDVFLKRGYRLVDAEPEPEPVVEAEPEVEPEPEAPVKRGPGRPRKTN